MKEKIKVNGKEWSFVTRRDNAPTSVYKGDNEFLRTGPAKLIAEEVALHRKLLKLGFPVAKIKTVSKGYFIEESLGDTHFGYIFRDDIKKIGKISDKNFQLFLNMCLKFAQAQLQTSGKKDWNEFKFHTNYDHIVRELPQLRKPTKQALEAVQNKIQGLPFVITHGDFGPFNIYPKGVIDLEHSFEGPLGFDLATPIIQTYFFPRGKNHEFFRIMDFSENQKNKYFSEMNKLLVRHGFPKLTDYLNEFILCRTWWSAARMHRWPKLQAWRYKQYKRMLRGYLNNQDLIKLL